MVQGINNPSNANRVSSSSGPSLNAGGPDGGRKFKPADHRKDSLASAMNAIKAGKGTLSQVITHWKDISHRTKGIETKSFFSFPIDFRGTSLSTLDKAVKQFQNNDWASHTQAEYIDGLKTLRDQAKTHLTQSGKRHVSTQLLIDKCNDVLAETLAKTPISRATLREDLINHQGQISQRLVGMSLKIDESDTTIESSQLADEIAKKVGDQTLSLADGLRLMKSACTSDVYLQTASSLICEHSKGNVGTLTQLLDAGQSNSDTQMIQEVTLAFVQSHFMNLIDSAVSQLPTIFKECPPTTLMVSKSLENMIQRGALDDAIRTTPQFFGSSGPVTDVQLSQLKGSPDQVTEFASRMLQNPQLFADRFQQLCEDPSIGLPILKGHIQSSIIQAKSPAIGHSVRFLQQLEIAQFNRIDALNVEKERIKKQLDTPGLPITDHTSLSTQKDAVSKQLQSLERGEFQDAIGTIDASILSDIMSLNGKSYAERAAIMPGIIARTQVSEIIQKTMIDASLAMLDRSTQLVDIESDIHTTNQAVFNDHQTTATQLAQNLSSSLYSVNLVQDNGRIQYGKSTLPNHHAFAILKQLIDVDTSITDRQATIVALKSVCFPADDDHAFSTATLVPLLASLPPHSSTLKSIELLSSKYSQAVTHHMVFDFMDDLPNLPTENHAHRSITLSTESTGITITQHSEFNVMDATFDRQAASFTTIQSMRYDFGKSLSTQFKLGQCQLSDSLASKSGLQQHITDWNGQLVSTSPKPPLSQILDPLLPTAAVKVQQLVNGLKDASKMTTEYNIHLLESILTQLSDAPKSVQFQCLTPLEALADTLKGQLIDLKRNGHYRGVNLKHLFTSKSIWNTHSFDASEGRINRVLQSIQDLRYAGTKLEKSEGQQYTIIEGAQGNRYELLTHLSDGEAKSLGIEHFLTEKFSSKRGDVEKVIQVGKGAFKTIRLARNMGTGEIVIVGKSKFSDPDDPRIADFFNEVSNHLGLTKTSVIQLQDQALLDIEEGQKKGYTFMKLGRASGERVVDALNAPGMTLEDKHTQTSQISIDLIHGVAEFEATGFIHGDIKPLNFVIDDANHAHWIDFGTGRHRELAQLDTHDDQINVDRTPHYVPRDLTGFGSDQFHPTESIAKKDAWALGVTLYQAWTNTLPFGITVGTSEDEIATLIHTQSLDTAMIPEPHKTVIEGLLTKAPSERWSASDALKFIAPRLAETIAP